MTVVFGKEVIRLVCLGLAVVASTWDEAPPDEDQEVTLKRADDYFEWVMRKGAGVEMEPGGRPEHITTQQEKSRRGGVA